MRDEDKGSRKKAIRLKCLDCCCGNPVEVRLCNLQKCPLWRFRLGTEKDAKKAALSGENPADESQPIPKENSP